MTRPSRPRICAAADGDVVLTPLSAVGSGDGILNFGAVTLTAAP